MELIGKVFRKAFVQLILLYLILAALAIYFGDRGWYEPDGVSILAGSLNLPQAKQGDFFLYAYFIQPLTYEFNYVIFRLFKEPYLLYLLPAFLGAMGVCFLTLAVHFFSQKKLNIFFSFCILLFFPELFYRLLYPSSSVFAMLFFGLSLLLLYGEPIKQRTLFKPHIKYFLVGVISTLACFFRCDFLLGLPMLFYLVWLRKGEAKPFLWYILGSAAVFSMGFFSRVLNPAEIFRISSFYSALAKEPSYWNQSRSFLVLFFSANVFIWLGLFFYAAIRILDTFRRRNWLFFLFLIPLAILFYPVAGGLTSTHYILPAICFAPFAIVKLILYFNKKAIVYIAVAFSIFLQLFSFELSFSSAGFFYPVITIKPSYVASHDGLRSSGAYLLGYYQVYQSNKLPCLICPLGLAHSIAKIVSHSNSDFLMVYAAEKEHNHLISLGLYSVPFFLEVQGYKLSYAGNTMVLTGKHNKLSIRALSLEEYKNFSETALTPKTKLIKVPFISRSSPELSKKLTYFFTQLLTLVN